LDFLAKVLACDVEFKLRSYSRAAARRKYGS
jgi:hypothetical protein